MASFDAEVTPSDVAAGNERIVDAGREAIPLSITLLGSDLRALMVASVPVRQSTLRHARNVRQE